MAASPAETMVVTSRCGTRKVGKSECVRTEAPPENVHDFQCT